MTWLDRNILYMTKGTSHKRKTDSLELIKIETTWVSKNANQESKDSPQSEVFTNHISRDVEFYNKIKIQYP